MKRTDTRANVGAKSVRSVVQLRGKPCSLKRHFKGCLRQVVGYLDMLAARDPDRFVWSSAENIQRHARKWKGGGAYSRSQVFFWLHEAEQLGLLRPTVRTRHGIRRKGFVVTSHDALIPGAVPDHSVCVLEFKPDSEVSQTGLESSQTGLEDSQSGLQIGLNSLSDRTASRTSDRTEKSQQVPEKEPNGPDTIEVLGEDSDEVRRVLALVTQSSQPCKESPEKTEPLFSKKNYLEEQGRENEIEEESAKGKTAIPPPTSSFKADLTETQTRGQGKSNKTIGNLVRIENAVGAEIIEAITDGEFHTEALPNYGPTDDLVQCLLKLTTRWRRNHTLAASLLPT